MVSWKMSRRTERVGSLIRSTLGELLLSKLSDPRVEPGLTSITRVEVPDDLLSARVYVSVMGTDGQQRRTLRALRHAAGRLQELMMQRIELRYTPVLHFELDVRFKETLETLRILDELATERQHKEQAASAEGPDRQAGAEPREDGG